MTRKRQTKATPRGRKGPPAVELDGPGVASEEPSSAEAEAASAESPSDGELDTQTSSPEPEPTLADDSLAPGPEPREEDVTGLEETVSAVGALHAEYADPDEELELTPRDRPGLEKAPPLPTGEAHLKGILESLLFVTDRPLAANRLAKIARATLREVQRLLDVLVEEYRGRGLELVEVAGGYQFRSSAENAPFVRELVARKPVRLTRAQIEALSILAYRQPITRPEIDEIRGVDTGSALKVLLEKNLVRIIGRKEEPGRPLLYGTTPYFLEFFGLPSLAELPTLREYSELSDESRALFQRRTGEAIDQIGNLGLESRHYSEDEVEAEEALAARRLHGEREADEDEDDLEPAAQGELPLGGNADAPAGDHAQLDDDEEEEDEEDDDDDEDDEDEE